MNIKFNHFFNWLVRTVHFSVMLFLKSSASSLKPTPVLDFGCFFLCYSVSCFHPVLCSFFIHPTLLSAPSVLSFLYPLSESWPPKCALQVSSKLPSSYQNNISCTMIKPTPPLCLSLPFSFAILSFYAPFYSYGAQVHPMCILAWSVIVPEISQTTLIKSMQSTHMRIISISCETVNG